MHLLSENLYFIYPQMMSIFQTFFWPGYSNIIDLPSNLEIIPIREKQNDTDVSLVTFSFKTALYVK